MHECIHAMRIRSAFTIVKPPSDGIQMPSIEVAGHQVQLESEDGYMKAKALIGVASVIMSLPAMASAEEVVKSAEDTKEAQVSDKVVVKGILPDKLETVPGSFKVVDEEELTARRPFSIQEALNTVPGIHIVGEVASGMKVNIGVRGLNPRRTSRTLMMEDGMPIMLAPYGDPSNHYFTPLDRVERIEVVKGSGQILYGPQTVGGMINFVTRPVPTEGFKGSVSAMAGNNNFSGAHVNMGYGDTWGGVMLDVINRKGDGIRKDESFELNDVTLKTQFNLTDTQTLIAKASWFEEKSRDSEAGLNVARYDQSIRSNPFGRNNVFEQERKTLQLIHAWELSDMAKLNTQFYWAKFERASYRQIDDSNDQMTANAATGCAGAARRDYENFANLCGNKMRPREFEFWGIEPRLDFSHNLFGLQSDAVVGFRYHEEDQNRKRYNGITPRARENDPGSLLRDENDIKVEAWSAYAQNTLYAGDFAITPGLRMERVRRTNKQRQVNFVSSNLTASETDTELLPGLGVAWNGIANTTVFGGVHRGFAPPRPDRDLNPARALGAGPEKSTNYELGFRTAYFKGISFEGALFHIDFDNLVVGPIAGEFRNAGRSEHTGLELAGRVDFGTIYDTPHNFYVLGSYTNLFTAKFKKDTVDTERGNRLPYAPRDIASLNFGYNHPIGIDARIGVDYVSQQYVDNENTRIEDLTGQEGLIPSYTLLNASVNFRPVGSPLSYFLSAHNVANKEYLISRVDGKHAGRERQVFGGVRYDF